MFSRLEELEEDVRSIIATSKQENNSFKNLKRQQPLGRIFEVNYSIYQTPPPNFTPQVEVAGCFCQWNDQVLFLKRHQDKPQGSTWGLPAGKLEKGESPSEAAIREVAEEVGLDVREELEEVGKIYIRLEHVGYIFHMFAKRFKTKPQIILEKEAHEEARWVTLDEALKLPLILGGQEVIQLYKEWVE